MKTAVGFLGFVGVREFLDESEGDGESESKSESNEENTRERRHVLPNIKTSKLESQKMDSTKLDIQDEAKIALEKENTLNPQTNYLDINRQDTKNHVNKSFTGGSQRLELKVSHCHTL